MKHDNAVPFAPHLAAASPAPRPEEAAARLYFPRGLVQPEGSFRFSADALLLAAFASNALDRAAACSQALDLGSGCGVVGLSFLLNRLALGVHALPVVYGVERDGALAQSATDNAARLGLSPFFRSVRMDVADVRGTPAMPPHSFDVVLANPPFRNPHAGRVPANTRRLVALFADDETFKTFLDAAACSLREKGRFFCVLGANALVRVLQWLADRRLEPKRLRPVYGAPGREARIVLVEARLGGKEGCLFEAPLTVWSGGQHSTLTDEALAFCPALGCNSKKREDAE